MDMSKSSATYERLMQAAWETKRIFRPVEVASFLGETSAVVGNWKSRGVPLLKMESVAKKIGCRLAFLRDGELPITDLLPSSNTKELTKVGESNVSPAPDVRGRVPLISWVQAGVWSEAVDIYEPGYAERWLPFIKHNGENVFALRVEGDSMTARFGKSYPDGCIIFVDPDQRMPENGDRIIAKLEGSQSVTFKVFTRDAGRCWLRPLNETHPPIFDAFSVVGKVIGKWEDE